MMHQGGGVGGASFGSVNSSGKPTLHIHAATFADADVTRLVQAMVKPDQSFEISNNECYEKFGDPWVDGGLNRQFIVLYQYGDRPMELLIEG